jgi:hypothetical protein
MADRFEAVHDEVPAEMGEARACRRSYAAVEAKREDLCLPESSAALQKAS